MIQNTIPKKISVPNSDSDESTPPCPYKIPETLIPPKKKKRHTYDEKDHAKLKWTSKIFYKSVDNGYNMDENKPKVGDLVISTIGEINHPAVFWEHFSKSSNIIGGVVGFL